MSMGHVTMALLLERGCPEGQLEAALDHLGVRVPPDTVEAVLADIDAAISAVSE